MNWTGGRLQRHSNKNGTRNSVAARQRQHFAKVRQARLNQPSSSPSFKPSFIPERLYQSSRVASSSRRTSHHGRQTLLEEFDSVAPVVKRLSRMTDRDNAPDCRFGENPAKVTHSYQQPTKNPIVARPDRTSPVSSPFFARQQIQNESSLPESADQVTQAIKDVGTTDSFEKKRLELLGKRDWVGIEPSKPVQVDYSALHGETQNIGKRRKLTSRDKQRQERAVANVRYHVPSVREEYMMSGALQPWNLSGSQDLSIRIGDAALEARSVAAEHGAMAVRSTQTASSDSMLMDEEGFGLQEEQNKHTSEEGHLLDPVDHLRRKMGDQNHSLGMDEPELPEPATQFAEEAQYETESLPVFTPEPTHAPLVEASKEPSRALHEPEMEDEARSIDAAHGSTMAKSVHENEQRFANPIFGNRCNEALWRDLMSIPSTTDSQDTTTTNAATKEVPIVSKNRPVMPFISDKVSGGTQSASIDHTLGTTTVDNDIQKPAALAPDKTRTEHDADALWKAFVFGNSSPKSAPSTRDSEVDILAHNIVPDIGSQQAHASSSSQQAGIANPSSFISYDGGSQGELEADCAASDAAMASSASYGSSVAFQAVSVEKTAAATKGSSETSDCDGRSLWSDPSTSELGKLSKHRPVWVKPKSKVVFRRPTPFIGTSFARSDQCAGQTVIQIGKAASSRSNCRAKGKGQRLDEVVEEVDLIEEA